ncbi:tRNA lysidine(34) synthetase TilS [Pediococcus siamensis]|uniref:tRNA lysidine(34) synthetase TilS n=1 Tax=Pediococcus siamensis TaxID=381829 RepID=UPI00399EEF59
MGSQVQKQFASDMQKYQLTSKDTVVVAVSTGVDSMVLLTLLQHLAAYNRPQIVVAHVNHQLRAQSTIEQEFITDYTASHHLKLEVKVWPKKLHPQTGVENAARLFRYQFFAEVARKHHARYVFTAHHADDQAETFLMKLVRGGNLQQLQGIQTRSLTAETQVARPLLSFSKATLRAFAKHAQVQWYEDETNQDENYTRNRMRHEIVPRLKAENPRFLVHVQAYTTQLQQLLTASKQRAEQLRLALQRPGGYETAAFLKLTPEWQSLTLQAICRQSLGADPVTDRKQAEILQLLRNQQKPNGKIKIQSQFWFEKNYQNFGFVSQENLRKKALSAGNSMLRLNQWQAVGNIGQVGVFDASKVPMPLAEHNQMMQLSENQIKWPLQIKVKQSTALLNLKQGGRKSVRRTLVDAKVPVAWRKVWPLLMDADNQPLWLLGLRKSWLRKPLDRQAKQYWIIWKLNNLEEFN